MNDAKDVLKPRVFWTIPNDYRAFADALTRGRAGDRQRQTRRRSRESFVQLAAKLGGTSQTPLTPESNGADTSGSRFSRLLSIGRKR